MHQVYIVRCKDGTLYTGYAKNSEARVALHNAGRGAKYTAGRRPVLLVYLETLKSRSAALKRELQVKRLTRARKEILVATSSTASIGARSGPSGRSGE